MIYKLKVFPNSGESRVINKDSVLNVYVKSKPEKNKANIEVIKLMARYFNTAAEKIKLKALKSRTKYIEIKE